MEHWEQNKWVNKTSGFTMETCFFSPTVNASFLWSDHDYSLPLAKGLLNNNKHPQTLTK